MAQLAEVFRQTEAMLNNVFRGLFFDEDELIFLKFDGGDAAYQNVGSISNDWFLEKSEFPGVIKMTYAGTDEGFAEMILMATSMAVEGYVYQIDKATTEQPTGETPYWIVRANKSGERYP